MYIYKITNTVNGKIYIGQVYNKSVQSRFLRHIREAAPDSRSYLDRSIYKYGADKFIVEQIDTANDLNELNKKEIYWIWYYNSTDKNIGYNLTNGGDGGNTYKYKTKEELDEIKKKISKVNTGKNNAMSKQIKAMNIITGKIYEFDTLHDVLLFVGIKHKDSIISICEHKNPYYYKGIWNFAYQGENFSELDIRPNRKHYGSSKCTLINKETKQEYIFKSKAEAKRFAGICTRENETSTWKIVDFL